MPFSRIVRQLEAECNGSMRMQRQKRENIEVLGVWNEHLSSNSLTCRYVILPMHSHVSWKHLRSPARHFRLRLALGGGRVVSEPSFYPLLWPALSGRNVEQRSTGLARWKNNWLCSAAAVRFHIEGFSFWLPLWHHSQFIYIGIYIYI